MPRRRDIFLLIVSGDWVYCDWDSMVEQSLLHGVPGNKEQDKKHLWKICLKGPTHSNQQPPLLAHQGHIQYKPCVFIIGVKSYKKHLYNTNLVCLLLESKVIKSILIDATKVIKSVLFDVTKCPAQLFPVSGCLSFGSKDPQTCSLWTLLWVTQLTCFVSEDLPASYIVPWLLCI